MRHTFEGQVALVTGGSSGIGTAIAKILAERGARVVITGRNHAALQAVAAQHSGITPLASDVRSARDTETLMAEIERRFGRLDVLVNNAGIAQVVPLAEATPEHARDLFETNVIGLVEVARRALPMLKASKGTIVNIASTIADQPFANMSVYCATKGAVVSLTRSWAQELGPDGIRVNVVSPGPIETPLYEPSKLKIGGEQLQSFASAVQSLVPLSRFGKPEEVAEVVAFVASRAASYVNGTQYTVGGGMEA